MAALPPTADQSTWEIALAQLRTREKAATRKLDALAAARRRLPWLSCPPVDVWPARLFSNESSRRSPSRSTTWLSHKCTAGCWPLCVGRGPSAAHMS